MAVSNIWKIHSIMKVPSGNAEGDAANPTIAAISSVGFPVQANVVRDIPAGNIYATTGRIDFTTVDLSFTTTQVDEVLSILSPDFAECIGGGDVYHVYVAKYDCSGPLAGSVHRRYTFTNGIFFLNSMQADHKADMTVSGTIQGVYDGAVDPVTVVDNAALPSAAQLAGQDRRWSIYTALTNGNAVQRKTTFGVDFGVSTSTTGADGDVFDSFASVDSVLPVVSAGGIEPTWFDSPQVSGLGLTINGTSVTHANTYFKFRRRDGAGGFIADGTAAHITISANGPAYYDQLFSGGGTDAGTTSIRVEATENSAGDEPLLFGINVAI